MTCRSFIRRCFTLSLKEIRDLLETNGVPFDPKIKDKLGFKVVLDAFLEEQAEFKIVSKENLLLYDVDKLKRFLTYWHLVFSAKARSLEKLQALALTLWAESDFAEVASSMSKMEARGFLRQRGVDFEKSTRTKALRQTVIENRLTAVMRVPVKDGDTREKRKKKVSGARLGMSDSQGLVSGDEEG